MKPLQQNRVNFGSDPEFFLQDEKGKIVGSERLVPVEGLAMERTYKKDERGNTIYEKGNPFPIDIPHIVRDGVQIEIHPKANTCRQSFNGNLYGLMRTLLFAARESKKYTINTKTLIKIDKKELMSLDKSSRQFGCKPSYNIYGEKTITVNPEVYRFRSAGGHIHVGKTGYDSKFDNALITQTEVFKIIAIMDILVGNTCVLIDKDKNQIERRKNYGRAGEYRMTSYGFEYRTLSNFWLRSPYLSSLVMGLTRTAVNVVLNSTKEDNYEEELLKLVNMKDIEKAINTNDYKLALHNFKKIKPWIKQALPNPTCKEYLPLYADNLKEFEHFITKPIEYWFGNDNFERIVNKEWDIYTRGFETFLSQIVASDLLTKQGKRDEKRINLKDSKLNSKDKKYLTKEINGIIKVINQPLGEITSNTHIILPSNKEALVHYQNSESIVEILPKKRIFKTKKVKTDELPSTVNN